MIILYSKNYKFPLANIQDVYHEIHDVPIKSKIRSTENKDRIEWRGLLSLLTTFVGDRSGDIYVYYLKNKHISYDTI